MLTEGGDLVKLADFGLAINMDENSKEEANEEVKIWNVLSAFVV